MSESIWFNSFGSVRGYESEAYVFGFGVNSTGGHNFFRLKITNFLLINIYYILKNIKYKIYKDKIPSQNNGLCGRRQGLYVPSESLERPLVQPSQWTKNYTFGRILSVDYYRRLQSILNIGSKSYMGRILSPLSIRSTRRQWYSQGAASDMAAWEFLGLVYF
jgi:hypothetical protein